MSDVKKNILIVEDDEHWKKTLTALCQRTHQKLYQASGNIIQVATVKDAVQVLETERIHFASVDLNLQEDEIDTKDPGGLTVLKEIHDRKLDTVAIVVSGEHDPEFSAIAKKYGVLTFQQKDKLSFPQTYLIAVEAALLYSEAKALLDDENYPEALRQWQMAKTVVRPIETERHGANDWTFPIDIEAAYHADFKHSVSHLPTSLLIEDEFRSLFLQDQWILFYIEIVHLSAFAESQGLPQAEVLLRITKSLIEKHFTLQPEQRDFFGQTSDDIFVIASNQLAQTSDEELEPLMEIVTQKFAQEAKPHYDFKTREQGRMSYEDLTGETQTSPLAYLTIATIRGERNTFKGFDLGGDIRDLDRVARRTLRDR
ncbi:MAG: hypothetical protein AAF485_02155 [Chloroflexota bacterium]